MLPSRLGGCPVRLPINGLPKGNAVRGRNRLQSSPFAILLGRPSLVVRFPALESTVTTTQQQRNARLIRPTAEQDSAENRYGATIDGSPVAERPLMVAGRFNAR